MSLTLKIRLEYTYDCAFEWDEIADREFLS